MREADLEKKLRTYARLAGGFTMKLVPEGETGLPDRLVVLPGGVVWFIELKTPKGTGRVTAKQLHWAEAIETLGCRYLCTNDPDELKKALGL